MLPQSRRGQVLLGIVMFLSPFFLVRVILVMSGAIPGMTLLGSPAGVIDTRAVWQGFGIGWKAAIFLVVLIMWCGVWVLLRAVFRGVTGKE